jgi:peptidoglycan/LPS O-acetylase OafA/YrhL
VGLAGCATTLWWFSSEPVSANLRFSALAIFCFGLVGSASLADPGTLSYKVLTQSWLRYAGKICFGLYLLHVTVFDILTPERLAFLGNGWVGSLAVLAIDFGAAYLIAVISWRFFESPIPRMKHKFEYGRRPEVIFGCPRHVVEPCRNLAEGWLARVLKAIFRCLPTPV